MSTFWKYTIVGLGIIGFITCMTMIGLIVIKDPQVSNAMNVIIATIGLILTFILFLHSQKSSNEQSRINLDHLQALNSKQIKAIQDSSEKQILEIKKSTGLQIKESNTLNQKQIKEAQKLTKKQIDALHELNKAHIDALNKSTGRQIEAIQLTTNAQIYSFEEKTNEMIYELTDNSIFLGEILGRQLEDAILDASKKLNREEQELRNIKKFKLGRFDSTRVNEINTQQERISHYKKVKVYFAKKYEALQSKIKGLNQ